MDNSVIPKFSDSVIPKPEDSVIPEFSDSVIPKMNNSVIQKKDVPRYHYSYGGVPLYGHQGVVSSVSYSPDGCKFISGSYDSTIRIWDTITGKQIGENIGKSYNIKKAMEDIQKRIIDKFEDHNSINTLCYSPDGKIIVCGCDDGFIYMWDTNTRKLIRKSIVAHRAGITCISCSPDGSKILSCSESGETLREWDFNTGKQIGEPFIGGHEYPWVRRLSYSPNGRHFVTGSADSTICLWDAKTRELLGKPFGGEIYSGKCCKIMDIKYSPDGSKIVSAGGSIKNQIFQWDANDGKLLGAPFMGRTGIACSASYNPDGSSIVCGYSDGTICILDSDTFEILSGPPIQGHNDYVTSISHSPDGRRFVTGCWDGTICQWDSKEYNADWDSCDYVIGGSSKWDLSDWDPNDPDIFTDSDSSEY